MRFPGNRIPQHYFPVEERPKRLRNISYQEAPGESTYVVGLDQLIVDLEVVCGRDLLDRFQIPHGESIVLSDERFDTLKEYITANQQIHTVTAGGAVGNTLNNYTFLSGERAFLLGAIDDVIHTGSFAFRYINDTPRAVALDHCVPRHGHIATAITFVTPDGERSFAVNMGIANNFPPEAIPAGLVEHSAGVLLTAFCLRDPNAPIYAAAIQLMKLAKEAQVPVIFSLGTSSLIRENQAYFRDLLQRYVTCAAMNNEEALALTNESNTLLACNDILDLVDIVVITEGAKGLTMAGFTDDKFKRPTDAPIRSKGIENYNAWEYSRLMRKRVCENPIKIFSHIHPYLGGPQKVVNTNGAGDAAIAAILHDIAANKYHRNRLPDSEKHKGDFLTYSSLARNAQYANRVAYQVLLSASPRLDGQLPDDTPLQKEEE